MKLPDIKVITMTLLASTLFAVQACLADTLKLDPIQQKEYDELSKQIENNPKDYSLWARRAVVLRRIHNLSRAEPDVEEALRCDPHWQQGYLFEAEYFAQCGRYSDAILAMKKAESIKPLTAREVAWRGAVYGKLRDFKSELRDYDKAIELDPTDYGVYTSRALLKLDIDGPSEDVIRDLERSLALNPSGEKERELLNAVRQKLKEGQSK